MFQSLLELYKSYSAFTASNQFLGAALAAAGLGAATWLIRDVPRRVYRLVWKSCTVSLELHYDDLYHNRQVFIHLANWLSANSVQLLSRTFTLSLGTRSWSARDSDRDLVTATGGSGTHLVWHNNKLYWYSVDKETGGASSVTKQNLTLKTFGFNTLHLKSLVTDLFVEPDESRLKIMSRTADSWSRMYVNSRSAESVILNSGVKDQLTSAVDQWRSSRERYLRLGINYKLSVLLSGPPGTGKTSVAKSLASYCKVPLYTISLSSQTDATLEAALLDIQSGAVLLLEDIDCATDAVASREDSSSPAAALRSSASVVLTLSGILNVLDGVKTPEDLIIVMTTNHSNRLDPAVLRAGRTDLHLVLSELDPSPMSDYSQLVYAKPLDVSRCRPMKGCDLQAIMLENPTDHAAFSARVYEISKS